MADLVRRAAARRPEHPALVAGERTVTWSELDARVDAYARGLLALDLPDSAGHPARVAVVLPNVVEYAALLFGIWRAGLVAVPTNPGFTESELRHVREDSGAALVIGMADTAGADYTLGGTLAGLARADGEAVPDAAPGLAALLYTSGTSGRPRGAMLSHAALLANHDQLARVEPPIVGPDDVVLLVVPLFHAYGLNSGLGAVAYHGATGVLVERFDPADTLAAVRRHRVTAVLGVPTMYAAWSLLPEIGDAFTDLRVAVSGAAPLDQAAADRFQAATGKPVFEGYGLTETAPVLTSTLASPVPKPSSIGRPIPGVELRLDVDAVDLDEEGDDFVVSPQAPGTDPGEIVVRGANLFSGYWPDGREGPDADGWWRTGDIAYADVDGDLFLVDRLGELILVSGFNVYPHEVELALAAHPAVAEAAVVGEPHPYTGETVKAYVVTSAEVTGDELIAWCEQRLARFKCPTAIQFVSRLPHSATGKVRKSELREV